MLAKPEKRSHENTGKLKKPTYAEALSMLAKPEKRSHENTGKLKKPTYAEAFFIGDLIRLHCKRVGDYAIYDDGWSDQEVLKQVGGTFVLNNVENIRRQIVGPLRISKMKKADLDLEERIAKLEKIANDLEDWAASRPREPYYRA